MYAYMYIYVPMYICIHIYIYIYNIVIIKQVSTTMDNNQLSYKYFSGKILIDNSNRLFRYRHFNPVVGSSVTYSISLALGTYTPKGVYVYLFLQCVISAAHCNTLQHAATYYNIL